VGRFVLDDRPGPGPHLVLDDDARCCSTDCPTEQTSGVGYGGAELSLWKRLVSGWSAEGNPEFGWEPLTTAPSVLVEERREFDADSGMTSVKATATVPYRGEDMVRETIVARADDGREWRVTAVQQYPDRLELTMDRIDQEPGEP
jgi:hypothetical protein